MTLPSNGTQASQQQQQQQQQHNSKQTNKNKNALEIQKMFSKKEFKRRHRCVSTKSCGNAIFG